MNFYVTLPSNASMQTYPENKQSSFTTILKNPLDLSERYEVALVEMSYTHSIINEVGTVIVFKDNNAIFGFPISVTENTDFIQFIDLLNQEIFESFLKIDSSGSKNIKDYNNKLPFIEGHKEPGFFKINVPASMKIKFSGKISAILGVESTYDENNSKNKIFPANDHHIHVIDSFLIYVDIVEDQVYGDSMSSIIRAVIPKGNKGERVSILYDNPHYVNLKKTSFNSIHINIRDSAGELIKFSNLLGKVILKLHFRIKK